MGRVARAALDKVRDAVSAAMDRGQAAAETALPEVQADRREVTRLGRGRRERRGSRHHWRRGWAAGRPGAAPCCTCTAAWSPRLPRYAATCAPTWRRFAPTCGPDRPC